MSALLIKGGTVVRVHETEEVDILIENNVITRIAAKLEPSTYHLKSSTSQPEPSNILNAAGMLIFPGLIDCHVHFREPGFEHKETLATGAKAARTGGVTTVCDMPNTNPPTTTVKALEDKVIRAARVEDCDIRFFFGVTEVGHMEELRTLLTGDARGAEPRLRNSVCGVKVYFDHSTGHQKAEQDVMEEAFRVCTELGIPLVGHCEDPEINYAAKAHNSNENVAAHSELRPPASEEKAIATGIELARKHGTRFHVAHISTKQGVELVRQAKENGLPITCEVTPHHLLLTEDHYEHFGTLVKMNPPLRTEEHLDALWAGVEDHTIDCIATDHAPHTLEEKQSGPPLEAPSGVPGVETMFPLLLTVASLQTTNYPSDSSAEASKLQTCDIVRLCFTNPNRIFNLHKPDITDGTSPDLVLVDPNEEWEVRGTQLATRCGWTPFEGFRATGRVKAVLRARENYRLPDNLKGSIV